MSTASLNPENSVKNFVSASGTNLTSVKGSSGELVGFSFFNNTAAEVYVRFYDAASPTVGTTTPAIGPILVPAGSGVNSPDIDLRLVFSTAIQFAVTTGMANTDTTGINANEVCGFVLYR